MAQNLAAEASSDAHRYVLDAERRGGGVRVERLQELGMDLLWAKIVAGMLGVKPDAATVPAATIEPSQLRPYPTVAAQSLAAIAVPEATCSANSGTAIATRGTIRTATDLQRDAQRPLLCLDHRLYSRLLREQRQAVRPQDNILRYGATKVLSNLERMAGYMGLLSATQLTGHGAGAGYLTGTEFLNFHRADPSLRELVHHLCDCGFLASEYFPTKVLRVNGLDRALKALVEKQPWPSLLRGDCDRQEVAEVIRLVYGEGQRREHLEKAAHIATKAAQLAGDLYDGMAPAQQQPLLPDVRRQALALLQLAVQEEEEAAAASSPPLLTLPPSSPSMVPVALGSWKLLQAIEKQLDDWTVEALAALAMRDPETTQPASLPRLESVQARVNAMVFLRRELCWKEPTHAKLTYLQERLGRARAFSLENCKNMGLSGKVLIETADQGEEVESLRDLIAQIEEMLEDDSPVLQRERAEAKLSHCREMLRRSKLDAGLPLGFVNVWVRDHPEVRALQSQVERLTQAEAGVAQGTVNGNTDRLSAKGSYVQYLAL